MATTRTIAINANPSIPGRRGREGAPGKKSRGVIIVSGGGGGSGTITTNQDGTTVSSTVTTLDIQGPAYTSGAGATAKIYVTNPALNQLCNGML